jgi:ABC-type Mn2+/Zn2+ transport system ATPase subunit
LGSSWRYIEGLRKASRFEVPSDAVYLPSDPFDTLIYPSVRDCFPRHIALASILEVIRWSGLDDTVLDQDLWQLSGGMLQRIVLARTRFRHYDLLVADQLHEWLDENGRQLLEELLVGHCDRDGICIATESTASPRTVDFPAMQMTSELLHHDASTTEARWSHLSRIGSPGQPWLQCSHLSKNYRLSAGSRSVLRDLSLTAKEFEWVGVQGPNGTGKSVLGRILAGIEDQDSGSIEIAGRRLAPAKRLQAVAYLSQMPSQQLPFPTVLDLVNGLAPSGARSEVFAQLDGLCVRPGHRVAQLTPALQRRVAFELLLLKRPQVLVVDEPTWGADANEVNDFIESLSRRVLWPHCTILISHDSSLLSTVCHSIVELRDGQILEPIAS